MTEPLVTVLLGTGWEAQQRALLAAGHRVVTSGTAPGPLLDGLELHGCVLAGFAAGTGDVIRYLAGAGRAAGRVRKAVLIGTFAPYLVRTGDNPDGIPRSALDPAAVAVAGLDLRADLPRIGVPVLLLHGEADPVMPIDATANRLPDLIADLRYEVVPGGPHDIRRAAPELVNRHLLGFASS